mmetsp:Transcript_5621/g.15784  ORF Transcript_5621/g.15784 Transcript_5621/m.15784 type:complete len:209 (-) Transcript_5621:304-930(-)
MRLLGRAVERHASRLGRVNAQVLYLAVAGLGLLHLPRVLLAALERDGAGGLQVHAHLLVDADGVPVRGLELLLANTNVSRQLAASPRQHLGGFGLQGGDLGPHPLVDLLDSGLRLPLDGLDLPPRLVPTCGESAVPLPRGLDLLILDLLDGPRSCPGLLADVLQLLLGCLAPCALRLHQGLESGHLAPSVLQACLGPGLDFLHLGAQV